MVTPTSTSAIAPAPTGGQVNHNLNATQFSGTASASTPAATPATSPAPPVTGQPANAAVASPATNASTGV